MARRSAIFSVTMARKPSSWMVISGVMATSATTPKASRSTASAPCILTQAPMAKGRIKPEVMGPLATPPESKAMAVYTGGTKSKVATYDNIFSFEMDKDYTFTFSNGATYKTSIMSYVKNLLANNPDNENIVNIVSAMYWYNQAANKVFS